MASEWPVQENLTNEGDRQYIGPETLLGQYDKPADIFALGLIMVEIAGNVYLPDYGLSWQRLRSGDLSDIPSLSSCTVGSDMEDELPWPTDENCPPLNVDDQSEFKYDPTQMIYQRDCSLRHVSSLLKSSELCNELRSPPAFLEDPNHPDALNNVIKSMLAQRPMDRPTAHTILAHTGIQWIKSRRRAGATIFEGLWGPADDVTGISVEDMDF